MSLININPTTTASWKELSDHYKDIKDVHMKSLFLEDSDRKKNMIKNYLGKITMHINATKK